jgi:hypothetical protein
MQHYGARKTQNPKGSGETFWYNATPADLRSYLPQQNLTLAQEFRLIIIAGTQHGNLFSSLSGRWPTKHHQGSASRHSQAAISKLSVDPSTSAVGQASRLAVPRASRPGWPSDGNSLTRPISPSPDRRQIDNQPTPCKLTADWPCTQSAAPRAARGTGAH